MRTVEFVRTNGTKCRIAVKHVSDVEGCSNDYAATIIRMENGNWHKVSCDYEQVCEQLFAPPTEENE